MAKDAVIIPFKDKMISLHFEEFEDTVDVDEAVKIDYHNLFAEIITIPVMMNRIGMWKAQSENDHAEAKLDRDIQRAQKSEYYRKKLKTVSGDKIKWPSIAEVDNAVMMDTAIQNCYKKVIRLEKEAAYMDSLYWAVKSKEMKINRISESMNLVPEEFEKNIVEGKWNGILIKAKNKLIPD